MQIIVTSGGERWRSTLAEFVGANEFPSEQIARMEATLAAGHTYRGGGGSEAAWSLEPHHSETARGRARQRLIDHLQREFYEAADPLEREAAGLAANTLAKLWRLSVSYPPPALAAQRQEASHASR